MNWRLRTLYKDDKLKLDTRVLPTISKNAGITGAAAIALEHCIPGLLSEPSGRTTDEEDQ